MELGKNLQFPRPRPELQKLRKQKERRLRHWQLTVNGGGHGKSPCEDELRMNILGAQSRSV